MVWRGIFTGKFYLRQKRQIELTGLEADVELALAIAQYALHN